MIKTEAEPRTYELDLTDGDGMRYVGRITGTELVPQTGEIHMFLTDDDRGIVYDHEHGSYHVMQDPHTESSDLPGPLAPYVTAMFELGLKATIEL